MIFHVAIAGHQLGNVILAELGKDNLERFAQKICEHIEAPAMRHAHANFLDATVGASVEDRIKNDHERFRALKRKPFLPHVARVQKNLERFGFEERPQQRHLNRARRGMLVRTCLQSLTNPFTHPRVLDMHEFRPDRVGVNSLQTGNQLAQRHRPIVEEELRGNAKIEIRFAESELRQAEQRILRSPLCERIDSRNGVTEGAIRVNETIDACLKRSLACFGLTRRCSVALRQISELEPFKKRRPPRINRLRIFLPAAVILLDQVQICASVNRCTHSKFNLRRLRHAAS